MVDRLAVAECCVTLGLNCKSSTLIRKMGTAAFGFIAIRAISGFDASTIKSMVPSEHLEGGVWCTVSSDVS